MKQTGSKDADCDAMYTTHVTFQFFHLIGWSIMHRMHSRHSVMSDIEMDGLGRKSIKSDQLTIFSKDETRLTWLINCFYHQSFSWARVGKTAATVSCHGWWTKIVLWGITKCHQKATVCVKINIISAWWGQPWNLSYYLKVSNECPNFV